MSEFTVKDRLIDGKEVCLEEEDQFSDNEIHDVKQSDGRIWVGKNEYVLLDDMWVPKRIAIEQAALKAEKSASKTDERPKAVKKSTKKEKEVAEKKDAPKVYKKKPAVVPDMGWLSITKLDGTPVDNETEIKESLMGLSIINLDGTPVANEAEIKASLLGSKPKRAAKK